MENFPLGYEYWTNPEERHGYRQVPSPTKSLTSADLSPWPSLYGSTPADPDNDSHLGQYIHRIYCRECREQENMAAASGHSSAATSSANSPGSQPDSPPQALVDRMTLAEKIPVINRRLMYRRSLPELVSAGIYPTSPHAFAGQRVLLERAKTGDILKHKIEQRPDRGFLVQQHILEDSNVDPSLQSAQRQLKKAKLTDELNEKLAHRPGPLELVEQRILEADDPIKAAIREGKLDFHKIEEGVEPTAIPKLPYEIESPKSGHSSPEPDCDNDSNSSGAGSTVSTGFGTTAVPTPPDITPLLTTPLHTSITIGGRTIKIPVTTQSFTSRPFTGTIPLSVSAPSHHQFTSIPQTHKQHPSNFGANRNSRRSKQSRPKNQMKQRVIKFHEYKGPTTSKSSHTSSGINSSFVTTTRPVQKLDNLTPYQVRVQQQQLYLQCQLEVKSKGSLPPTLLLPVQVPTSTATSIIQQQPVSKVTPEFSQPPTSVEQFKADRFDSPATPRHHTEPPRSRPPTPSLSTKSPSLSHISRPHAPLHVTRSLSHLEDMKVSDLKLELRHRNLTVSGPKPQLIERLRMHQMQELSSNVRSVSTSNSDLGPASISSVQSLSDDILMAPPSVASTSGMRSPPSTPFSPHDEVMRSPPSVQPKNTGAMDVDETSNPPTKSTAEIVREQAKTIEELQRTLLQCRQQLSMTQLPFVVPQSPAPSTAESATELQSPRSVPQPVQQLTAQQVQALFQQQQSVQLPRQQLTQVFSQQDSPVDITDKQVYLTTPDGKMTAYKVILHTGKGSLPQSKPEQSTSRQPSAPISQQTSTVDDVFEEGSSFLAESVPNSKPIPAQVKEDDTGARRGINVDDVLEVLIRTGEIDEKMIENGGNNTNMHNGIASNDSHTNDIEASSSGVGNSNLEISTSGSSTTHPTLDLHDSLSPFLDMEWADSDQTDSYLNLHDRPQTSLDSNDNEFRYDNNLDWLSDVISMDSMTPNDKNVQPSYNYTLDDMSSLSDPILTPKPNDMLNIFEIDDCDYRTTSSSGINW